MSCKEKKKRDISQGKRNQKPDYQKLKEILKSDEFLGREKFEKLRRQFGRQGRENHDDDQGEQCDETFVPGGIDDGEANKVDPAPIRRDRSTSPGWTEFAEGHVSVDTKDDDGHYLRLRDRKEKEEEEKGEGGQVEEEKTGRADEEIALLTGKWGEDVINEASARRDEDCCDGDESKSMEDNFSQKIGVQLMGEEPGRKIVPDIKDGMLTNSRLPALGSGYKCDELMTEKRDKECKLRPGELEEQDCAIRRDEGERYEMTDMWRRAKTKTGRMTLEEVEAMDSVLVERCWRKQRSSSGSNGKKEGEKENSSSRGTEAVENNETSSEESGLKIESEVAREGCLLLQKPSLPARYGQIAAFVKNEAAASDIRQKIQHNAIVNRSNEAAAFDIRRGIEHNAIVNRSREGSKALEIDGEGTAIESKQREKLDTDEATPPLDVRPKTRATSMADFESTPFDSMPKPILNSRTPPCHAGLRPTANSFEDIKRVPSYSKPRSKPKSIVDLETTPAEVKTRNWILRSLTDARFGEKRGSESSADTRFTRDIVSTDFDYGDSGIYGDLLKRDSASSKQKSTVFDASNMPVYDSFEETKAYWDCVLSSSTANSGPESEYSVRLSVSQSAKIQRERFRKLRNSVGNKWTSFSTSFLKLRRQCRTNRNLPPPPKCAVEHIRVLQDTVQAMQQCVKSLEGLELRLKEVLNESKSKSVTFPGEMLETNPNASRNEIGGIRIAKEKNRANEKIISKEELMSVCEKLARERKASKATKARETRKGKQMGIQRLRKMSFLRLRELDISKRKEPNRKVAENRTKVEDGPKPETRPAARFAWESELDDILEELGL